MRVLWLTALALAPLAVQARTLHNVPWYVAHDAARQATLRLCESDAQFANLPDCNNAEMAAAGAMRHHQPIGQRYASLDAELRDPRYWASNPIARDGNLENCERGIGTALAYCDAIRASVNLGR